MGFRESELWSILEEKVKREDEQIEKSYQIEHDYISAVEEICDYGVERATRIIETFPAYTRHDDTHICNVLKLMAGLLGDDIKKLSRDEAAMLIIVACCHDIGMSCSTKEKKELLSDTGRLNKYLESHPADYVKAYESGDAKPDMNEDMMQNYLRSIHHERVAELLYQRKGWPSILNGRIDREQVIRVCRSHGEAVSELNHDDFRATPTIDLRFCAILLRLADILDFDTSRAPEILYHYLDFQDADSASKLRSKEEWDKHIASKGFDLEHIEARIQSYQIPYSAICNSMQIEQLIRQYLDMIDNELSGCLEKLSYCTTKWQNFVLPGKVQRNNITSEGYISGQFHFMLDQDRTLELFTGENLYHDSSVFVRELLQNAIDAVRTRKQLDKYLPSSWTGQINICCWTDEKGEQWFRIEDNGVGMTEDVIRNYFLKTGSSYYSSDMFRMEMLKHRVEDPDYQPISRFGIGILSCFMGDKDKGQVEVSTKHFDYGRNSGHAFRLSMRGINRYYYLAGDEKQKMPEPMPGFTEEEKRGYRNEPGTTIVVHADLFRSDNYKSFKEIVDQYLVYPPVPVHYEDENISYNYPTEEEFMKAVHSINPSEDPAKRGVLEFPLSDKDIQNLNRLIPEIHFIEKPKLILKCFALDDYTIKKNLVSGAVLAAKIDEGECEPIKFKVGGREVGLAVRVEFDGIHTLGRFERVGGGKLGLKIFLAPEGNSSYMGWDSVTKILGKDSGGLKLLTSFGETDEYSRKLLRGIAYQCLHDEKWRTDISLNFDVTNEKLNNDVVKIRRSIEKEHLSIGTIQEYLELYDQYHKELPSFQVCDLKKFDWYQYFKNTDQSDRATNRVSHNGISCGGRAFIYSDSFDVNAVVLLKDRYLPNLNIARDTVRSLPLEAACELEIIRQRFINEGFAVSGDNMEVDAAPRAARVTMEKYLEVMNKRRDLLEQLEFDTEEGSLSLADLKEKCATGKINECSLSLPLAGPNTEFPDYEGEDLYGYLCCAVLREHFGMQVKFINNDIGGDSHIYISEKKEELPEHYRKLFPACFFLPTVDSKTDYLTTVYHGCRCACNSNHRLSQFIIKNGSDLKKLVPGIFDQLLNILAQKDGSDLIPEVNRLLDKLGRYHRNHFQVTEALKLNSNDIIGM